MEKITVELWNYNTGNTADVTIPIVPDINQRILAAIENGRGRLDMEEWHKCKTTHCIAGWAVALSPGAMKVEHKLDDTESVAEAIFEHSALGEVPYFFDDNKTAMDELRDRARREADALESMRLSEKARP